MLLTHSERFVNFNYIIKNIIIRTFMPRGRFGFTNRAVMSTCRLVSTAGLYSVVNVEMVSNVPGQGEFG
jgi:hypothetical protein